MITKIDNHKTKHQSNIKIFVLDYDNLIENKIYTNYEDQFKINQILKAEINKKKIAKKVSIEREKK